MPELDADAIIIGSGSGGLTAAMALAKAGEKVLVLEQHYVAGGLCHRFSKDGFSFHPGLHYIGQLGEGEGASQMYEGLGVAENLNFFRINPEGFEHCNVNGVTFDYTYNLDTMCERLCKQFPHESKGIRSYLKLLGNVSGALPEFFKTTGWRNKLTMPYRVRDIVHFGLFSLDQTLRWRIKDPTVRTILSVQCGDYALPPSKVRFVVHAGLAGHYQTGAYYPMGGGSAIANALVRGIRKHGGKVKMGVSVEEILVEPSGDKKKAIGVRLAGGEELRAKRVISNADPKTTYGKLIPEEHLSAKLKKRVANSKYSLGSLILFLGVDMDLRKAGLDSGNIWFFNDNDLDKMYRNAFKPNFYDRDELDGLFISASTLKDPTSYDGKHHTLEIVSLCSNGPFSKYKETSFDRRPEEYLKLKAKITEMMLKTLSRAIPGIRDHIVFCELGTPLSNSHYARTTDGCAYGTEKTLNHMGPLGYPVRSEIENLALVGSSTISHGVIGAATSGMFAAAGILGCSQAELLAPTGQKVGIHSADDDSQWPEWLKEKVEQKRKLSKF